MRSIWGLAVLGTASLMGVAATVAAAPTAAQTRQLEQVARQLQQAGEHFTAKRFEAAAREIRDLQSTFNRLAESSDPEVQRQVEPIYQRLLKAHAKLELEGFDFPPLKKPATPGAAPKDAAPAGNGPPGGVSFVKQIAPWIVARCGRCHVDNARGDFSMASYDQLKRGTPAGVVIFPGDPAGSLLLDKVASGEMPPGGNRLPAEEITRLRQWIQEGAKFDGATPGQELRSLAPDATPQEPAATPIVAATGSETISFARDVAPVLLANCFGCHVEAQRPRGELDMTTFASLLRGGERGAPLQPGQAATSLLMRRLRGEGDDPRMPMGRDPLPEAAIERVARWINEGAKFDGGDANLPIRQVAALARAQGASHTELSAERVALAEQNWQLGMPGIPMAKVESPHFLVLGNVGPATLQEASDRLEALRPKIASQLQLPTDQPLLKGRVTVYLFQQRYDYGEFGQMVEKRTLSPTWRGHWRFTVLDAYSAVVPPQTEEFGWDPFLAQHVAATVLASLGKDTPRWFAEGGGRMVAAKLAPKDARVASWESELSAAVGAMTKPTDFLQQKLSPEQNDVVSYSFVRFLQRNSAAYQRLLGMLRDGQPFEKAFGECYRGTPTQAAEAWAASLAARPPAAPRAPRRRK